MIKNEIASPGARASPNWLLRSEILWVQAQLRQFRVPRTPTRFIPNQVHVDRRSRNFAVCLSCRSSESEERTVLKKKAVTKAWAPAAERTISRDLRRGSADFDQIVGVAHPGFPGGPRIYRSILYSLGSRVSVPLYYCIIKYLSSLALFRAFLALFLAMVWAYACSVLLT
jgi:hypothetical protein